MPSGTLKRWDEPIRPNRLSPAFSGLVLWKMSVDDQILAHVADVLRGVDHFTHRMALDEEIVDADVRAVIHSDLDGLTILKPIKPEDISAPVRLSRATGQEPEDIAACSVDHIDDPVLAVGAFGVECVDAVGHLAVQICFTTASSKRDKREANQEWLWKHGMFIPLLNATNAISQVGRAPRSLCDNLISCRKSV